MKFENTNVYNFENALRGMRNPKQSWDKSDSVYGTFIYKDVIGKEHVNSEYFDLHGNKSIIKKFGGDDAHIKSIIKEKGYKPLIQSYCRTINDIKNFLKEHDFKPFENDNVSYFITLNRKVKDNSILEIHDLSPNVRVYDIDSSILRILPWSAQSLLFVINGRIIYIGPKDLELAQTLIKAGSVHRKFLRQIFVSVDISAPLYWWKEFDTYKVGTVANSTSTMHTMLKQPITADCFEKNELDDIMCKGETQDALRKYFKQSEIDMGIFDCQYMNSEIEVCEKLRKQCVILNDRLKENDKLIRENPKSDEIIPEDQVAVIRQAYESLWKRLIIRLPESWIQKRTVTMNYETLYSICRPDSRLYHKLNEWSGKNNNNMENFISWCKTLPYSEEFLFLKN